MCQKTKALTRRTLLWKSSIKQWGSKALCLKGWAEHNQAVKTFVTSVFKRSKSR